MSRHSPKIFINDTIFSHARQRGVSRYFHEITAGVTAEFGDKTIIFSSEPGIYGSAKFIHIPRFRRFRLHDLMASLIAYSEQATIFYSPFYGHTRTRAAEIFTVYDMIHEMFPQHFPASQRFIAEKRRCLERASALITISEHTAQDVMACYPHFDPSKIVTIHLGVDPFFFAGQPPIYQESQEKPFLLYVGHRNQHKNFLRLLTAFGQSGLAKEFNLKVFSPAGEGFDPQEVAYINRYHLQPAVHLVVNASDEMLRDSYARSVAFVYPSEYEGFGLPILEAMASGTVVATSNTSSMPEVGGEIALYFDPYSVEAIADCLRRVVDLPTQLRHERIQQGIARARIFTWSRCRQQTVDLFRKFI